MQDLVAFSLCERKMSMVMCFIVKHFPPRAKANFMVYRFFPHNTTCTNLLVRLFPFLSPPQRFVFLHTGSIRISYFPPPAALVLVQFILFTIDFTVINPTRPSELPGVLHCGCPVNLSCSVSLKKAADHRSLFPDE